MKQAIDTHIIQKFRNADQKAFRIIFDTLYAIMLSFARRYLNDTGDAEDMVQEAFIGLWNEKQKFLDEDQLKSFLYLTIRNKCLNRIKHLRIKEEYIQRNIEEYNKDTFFKEEVIRAEFLAQLKSVIDNLPNQRRKIILMNMNGYKNKEIAEELNISINTVKLQKKIAYWQLRKDLSSSLPALILIAGFFS